MVCRADTGVPVGEFTGIGIGVSNELAQGPRRHRWMNSDACEIGGYRCNWVEVLDWIIKRSAFKQGFVDVWKRATEEDGVTVGAGARYGRSTE